MPAYQTMFGRVNHHFNVDHLADTAELLGDGLSNPDLTLAALAEQLGVASSPGEVAELDKLPRGIAAALRALLADNFSRDEPWEVQFVWEPSYDYRLVVHEAGPSSISRGGISVIVGTRYPDDTLPTAS